MGQSIHIERRESCVILTIHHPPVNALTRELAGELNAALDELAAAPPAKLVITGHGRFFIAGADIREIQRITRHQAPPDLGYLNELLAKIENFPAPVVMAVNGAALGIGLETAMAGHTRVFAESATAALPEVHLGLIPGAGGTQRLPRLVGLAAALEMIESGRTLRAPEALRAGLADTVVPDEDLIAQSLRHDLPQRRTCDLTIPRSRATQAVLAACQSPDFAAGLALEAEIFRGALLSAEARNRVYLFFAERETLKLPANLPQGDDAPLITTAPQGKAVEVLYSEATDGAQIRTLIEQFRKENKFPFLVREPVLARLDTLAEAHDREAVRQIAEELLAAGSIQRLSDIDVLLVHGYGWLPEEGLLFTE
jgi:enoyl-CoA hydratase/carnithine racemase